MILRLALVVSLAYVFWFYPVRTEFSVLQQNFLLIASNKRIDTTNCSLFTVKARNNIQCAEHCMREPQCIGMNYQEKTERCELFSKNADLKLTEEEEFSSVFRRKVDCDDNPCYRNATCLDRNMTTEDYRAYTCNCSCGWCGWNCDIINFAVMEGSCIPRFNAGFKNVETKKECMEFCSDTPGCMSTDYLITNTGKHECWLNSVDGNSADIEGDCTKHLPKGSTIGYSYFNCTCPDPV